MLLLVVVAEVHISVSTFQRLQTAFPTRRAVDGHSGLRLHDVALLRIGSCQSLVDGHRRQWCVGYPVPVLSQFNRHLALRQLTARNRKLRVESRIYRDRKAFHFQLIHLIDFWNQFAIPFCAVEIAEGDTVLDEKFPILIVAEELVKEGGLWFHAHRYPVPVLVDRNNLLYLVALRPDGWCVEVTNHLVLLEDDVGGLSIDS